VSDAKTVYPLTRRDVVRGTALLPIAGAAPISGASAADPARWSPVPNGGQVAINGVRFEAQCGKDPRAVQVGANSVVRFTMIAGNGWPKDDPKASERTELAGWPSAVRLDRPIWCAWSFYFEPGAWTTSDWCILQQMYQVGGSPVVHVLKPDGTVYWGGVDAANPKASPYRHKQKITQGAWFNFVEVYKFDPVGGAGYWRSWVNGEQVLNFEGAFGSKGASHAYAKFGVYRFVYRTWNGIDMATLHTPANETISVRYANIRFGVEDLSRLVKSPDPIPPMQPA